MTFFAFVDWVIFVSGDFGFRFGEVDVLEEGTGARCGEGVGEFVGANGADDITNAFGTKVGDVVGLDVTFDGIVEWAGHLTGFEIERDGNNEVTVLGGGVENAFAIGKVEVGFGYGEEFIGDWIINIDFGESVGDFLTVSADVLNWCSAGETRDFAESFDAGKTAFGGEFDDVVPEFATHGFDGGGFGRDATHTIDNNYTTIAFVVADGVSATA